MLLTLKDGLTKQEAESFKRKTLLDESKLRAMGSAGNYSAVKVEESYRRGHTLDDREDVVRYKVVGLLFSTETQGE